MFHLATELASREEPVRVGVIGAGLFGTNLVEQLERTPGIEPSGIADIEVEKAIQTFTRAGVPRAIIDRVDDAVRATDAMTGERRVVLADGRTLATTGVDVIVEATGNPVAAAHHAFDAIMAGTHVVMATVEADTVVGPILAQLARTNGVTYAMAYGDQPALIVELHDWARAIGLDVIVAGKGNPAPASWQYGTPEDVFDRIGMTDTFVAERGLNPRMYNSFFDGTKVAVEMGAVGNALGFVPDVPRMHLPTADIPTIPQQLRPRADGGILDRAGVVETVRTVTPDGKSLDQDIGFGVFIVTSTQSERTQRYFSQYSDSGMITASDGRYQLFWRPFHLPGVETGISVAHAALHNAATGSPREHATEVVAAAKRELIAGDEIDGGGGYTVYGTLVSVDTATANGYVPLALLDGAIVERTVERDDIITDEHVRLDEDSFLYTLRTLQSQTIDGGGSAG